MAKSLLDIITGREDRPIRPEAMQGRRAPYKPTRLSDQAIEVAPEKLPPVTVTAKKEAPPKTGGEFWATVRDVVAGALKAYAMGPGQYLQLEEAKAEKERDRAHQWDMWNAKLKHAYEVKDAAAGLKLINQRKKDLVSYYKTIISSPKGKYDPTMVTWAAGEYQRLMNITTETTGLPFFKKTKTVPTGKNVIPTGQPKGKPFSGMTMEEIEAEIEEKERKKRKGK